MPSSSNATADRRRVTGPQRSGKKGGGKATSVDFLFPVRKAVSVGYTRRFSSPEFVALVADRGDRNRCSGERERKSDIMTLDNPSFLGGELLG
jgi:hypothetical protein